MKKANKTEVSSKVRLDKWLWAARFFKTRALAVHEIEHGRVQLNTQNAKPAREIKIEDKIFLQIGKEQFDVVVTAFSL